jgi:integrase
MAGQEAANLLAQLRFDGFGKHRPPILAPFAVADEDHVVAAAPLDGVNRLIAVLQYGAGLRLLECLQLRVEDLDGSPLKMAVAGVCDPGFAEQKPASQRPATEIL